MNLREQRLWLETHPGMPLDETTFHISVSVEGLAKIKDEFDDLLDKHLREIDPHFAEYETGLDMQTYGALDNAGNLGVITARDGADLVGYVMFVVYGHPHYRSLKTAFVVLDYVAPEYRGRGIFGRMMDLLLSVCDALYVKAITAGSRLSHSSKKSLEKRGFCAVETTYLRLTP